MQDLFPQSRTVFWGILLLLLALTMVPSLALIETGGQYVRFLLQWNPGAIPSTRMGHIPHRGDFPSKTQEPQLHFVAFALNVPQAKQVVVAGDFNGWQPQAMSPSSEEKGRWEILLPLPPGRYQYSFQ